MRPFLQADLDIAALTIWGEARGETDAGKRAVAHVLLNRWNADTGQFKRDDTLATTCLRHLQFSIWSVNDPNFARLFTVPADNPVYRLCMKALMDAMDETDPTEGSLHYHTLRVRPRWSRGKKPVVSIGGHKFFNDID